MSANHNKAVSRFRLSFFLAFFRTGSDNPCYGSRVQGVLLVAGYSASRTGSVLLLLLSNPADPQRWEAFVERYGPKIYGWCRQRGLQEADAQDVRGPLGRLASYHIVAERGQGAFGVVFQAYDEELACPVALKVLKPELAASATDRARFESEARKAAGVRHDHVVTIHRVGNTPGFALPYFVMEYVDGEA
jgi:hypothetical protein